MTDAPDTRPAAPPPRRGFLRRWLRRLAWASVLLVALLAGVAFGVNRWLAAPTYTGPVTDHFDGERFHNTADLPPHDFSDFLRWRRERDPEPWDDYRAELAVPRIEERVTGDDLRVTFVGHATVLIQVAGLNVLTDPVWSDRASPVDFAGPRRHAPPGLPFADLPPIDLVLISHNHYDHLDLGTLRRLSEVHGPTILLPLGNTAILGRAGIPGGHDLDWWDTHAVTNDVTARCLPAQHFSSRSFGDRNGTLWSGWSLETPAGTIVFAGDTGTGEHFAEIAARLGPPRLALLPIGAYLPRWFMSPVHMDPEEAVAAHLTLGATTSMGIHYGCFQLADDGPHQPLRDLETACAAHPGLREHFWTLALGETRDAPR